MYSRALSPCGCADGKHWETCRHLADRRQQNTIGEAYVERMSGNFRHVIQQPAALPLLHATPSAGCWPSARLAPICVCKKGAQP